MDISANRCLGGGVAVPSSLPWGGNRGLPPLVLPEEPIFRGDLFNVNWSCDNDGLARSLGTCRLLLCWLSLQICYFCNRGQIVS